MRQLLILVLVIAYGRAQSKEEKYAKIINQQFDIEPDGREFYYLWETENNIKVDVAGKVNNLDQERSELEQTGNVEYISPEGKVIGWKFRANANGYEAVGDVIPTSPPVPEYVRRLVNYLRSKPPVPEQ